MTEFTFEGDSVQIGLYCCCFGGGGGYDHIRLLKKEPISQTLNYGRIHDHDLRQGLVLAETTEEEDVCVLGRRAGGT